MRIKKIMFSIAIIALIVSVVLADMYLLFNFFTCESGARGARLSDIEVTSDSVAFDYHDMNSGISMYSYSYDVDDSGTLTIRFRSTIIMALVEINNPNHNHVIINNVHNVNKIVIADSDYSVTAWTLEDGNLLWDE